MIATVGTLEQVRTTIREWRDPLDTMYANDTGNPFGLIRLIQGEAKEAQEEAQKSGKEYQPTLEAKEIIDTIVFVVAYCADQEVEMDFAAVLHNPIALNGAGTHSNFYDRTITVAASLHDGNKEQNVIHYLSLLISRLRHLPITIDLVQITEEVIEKNRRNRRGKYYSKFHDLYGRREQLGYEDRLLKYHHVEKMLRALRTHYGSPLEDWMHEPFAELILDFKNHQRSLALLKEKMIQLDASIFHAVLHPQQITPEYLKETNQGKLLAQAYTGGLSTPDGRLSRRAIEHALTQIGNAREISISGKSGLIYTAA